MKKILICLVCALLVFSVCAFATDSDYVQNFDNVQNVADLKVKPGSGQKIEHITLDDTIKFNQRFNTWYKVLHIYVCYGKRLLCFR